MYRSAFIAGVFFAATAVILGAFGAHYLKTILTPEALASFETGTRYQFYHALALLICSLLPSVQFTFLKYITNLFILGILLFSGSIYALTVLKATSSIGLGPLGILTPIGGLLFIAAWSLLLFNSYKLSKT